MIHEHRSVKNPTPPQRALLKGPLEVYKIHRADAANLRELTLMVDAVNVTDWAPCAQHRADQAGAPPSQAVGGRSTSRPVRLQSHSGSRAPAELDSAAKCRSAAYV